MEFKDCFSCNLLILLAAICISCDCSQYSSDDRLLLTPLLENNDIENAINLSKVQSPHIPEDVCSYAGYITVDKQYNSNTWFWYFPTESKNAKAPLIMWLQGGPGLSSLFGLFQEIGPFFVDGQKINRRIDSLVNEYNLLFVDNPIGTGFSYTEDENGYAKNQTTIGKHLHEFLTQFLKIYSHLQSVPLYLSGRSYAGKHIPSLAYEIHTRNLTSDLKINLNGFLIGNAYFDPGEGHSQFLLQVGLLDQKQAKNISQYEKLVQGALAEGDLTKAFELNSKSIDMIEKYSRLTNQFNYISETETDVPTSILSFLEKPEIKKALHVGKTNFTLFDKVYDNLKGDLMSSAKPWLENLLDHYRVMMYSGQLDTVVPYPLSAKLHASLKWNKKNDFEAADRKPWFINNTLVGYSKNAGNLMEVMVRNAGHSPITDQPERMFLLIKSFINEMPLNNEPISANQNVSE